MLEDLYTILSKTIPIFQDNKEGHRAFLRFLITKEGNIVCDSIKVARNKSVPAEYVEAAIAAIKELKAFTPGQRYNGEKQKYENCACWMNLVLIYPIPREFVRTE